MYTSRAAFAINERWSLAHPSRDNDRPRARRLALTVSDRQGEWDKEMYSRSVLLTETIRSVRGTSVNGSTTPTLPSRYGSAPQRTPS